MRTGLGYCLAALALLGGLLVGGLGLLLALVFAASPDGSDRLVMVGLLIVSLLLLALPAAGLTMLLKGRQPLGLLLCGLSLLLNGPLLVLLPGVIEAAARP